MPAQQAVAEPVAPGSPAQGGLGLRLVAPRATHFRNHGPGWSEAGSHECVMPPQDEGQAPCQGQQDG